MEGYPFTDSLNVGPEIFLRRLGQNIARQGWADLTDPRDASADIGLFKIDAPADYPRPFVLRIDGIYFDLQNVVGDSDALNRPIFDSIDRAAGIVFISDFSRRLVDAFHHPVTCPSTIIHNAVDLDLFTPEGPSQRRRLGIGSRELVLLASAKWRRWKRLPEIVELFRRFRAQYDGACKLVVLGEGATLESPAPDIHLCGEIPADDLPSWYRTGDIYLHLATLEACGNTQIEAMACGLPVLCTNNGGIGETVRKARGGLVCEADPPFGFVKINHYQPASPDYTVLLRDLNRLVAEKSGFSAGIDRESIGMERAARDYVRFLEEISRRTPPPRSFTRRMKQWFSRRPLN